MGDGAGNGDRMTQLLIGQERLTGEITTLAARFDAYTDRTRSATSTLFEFKDKHEKRIGNIERDYVSKENFQRFENKLEAKIDAVVQAQDALKTAVIKVMVVGGLVITLVNVALGVLRVFV